MIVENLKFRFHYFQDNRNSNALYIYHNIGTVVSKLVFRLDFLNAGLRHRKPFVTKTSHELYELDLAMIELLEQPMARSKRVRWNFHPHIGDWSAGYW